MIECFHCGKYAVIWDSDFDAEDVGYINPGIVHMLHCEHCGASIEYYIPTNNDDATDTDKSEE